MKRRSFVKEKALDLRPQVSETQLHIRAVEDAIQSLREHVISMEERLRERIIPLQSKNEALAEEILRLRGDER